MKYSTNTDRRKKPWEKVTEYLDIPTLSRSLITTQTKTIRIILHIKLTTTTMPINAIPTMMSIGIAAITTKSEWHLLRMHLKPA